MKNYKELLAEIRPWAEETFKKLDAKLSKMTIRSCEKIVDGVDKDGKHVEKNINWWTNGFWGGLNWLMYNYTKNENYRKTAENSELRMDEALANYTALHHDVGFMWHPLSGASYALTGNEDSKRRSLFAASVLASRFVMTPGGGFIRAWNGDSAKNYSIIDCLMNLPLLYWASDVISDDRFKRIAMSNADMCLEQHLRPDGSVIHIVDHDRETGDVARTLGGQGYCDGSSWSRGHAWALYGFTVSYMHTKEERYLNAAKLVANYYIANVCDDWLPRVDFRSPSTPVYYDAAGGMCAACGLIELAKLLPEDEGGMYMHAAVNLLKAMTERFVNFNPETDDLVNFGTGMYPKDGMTPEKAMLHISIIYSDYYYTEAILKLLEADYFPW
jgi:unsaturated chondroitin disaccharide hydrolase